MDVKHNEIIFKCFEELKNVNQEVYWTDIVTALREEIVNEYFTAPKRLKKSFRGVWIRRVKDVAKEMNITVNMKNDNWHIIENLIKVKDTFSDIEPCESISLANTPSSSYSHISSEKSSSSKSTVKSSLLGYKIGNNDKEEIRQIYETLEANNMWKLSSGKNVEETMIKFMKILNYEHLGCSMILEINDNHWLNFFSVEELNEIEISTNCDETIKLPDNMKDFLNKIPKITNIKDIFLYLNSLVIDPYKEREVYWLKTSLQQAADLFVTGYLPITDHTERDIIRRIWGFIDTAYDSSDLTFRSEKTSISCIIENNKRRKMSADSLMERQRPGEIPDMKIYFDRYEFGAGEVSKEETNLTKEANDGSLKLGKIMKSMLSNLIKNNPEQQHKMKIIGMFFSGPRVNFLELSNPSGYVCVLKKTKEMYFPVHPKEFMKKITPLLEQVWINRMEMESTLGSVLTSESISEKSLLPPYFQRHNK